MGVITRHPEEPYANSARTVPWEVRGASRAPTRLGMDAIYESPDSLGDFACQAVFVFGFSFSLIMVTYWLTKCFDNPVVRVTNSMSGLCSKQILTR